MNVSVRHERLRVPHALQRETHAAERDLRRALVPHSGSSCVDYMEEEEPEAACPFLANSKMFMPPATRAVLLGCVTTMRTGNLPAFPGVTVNVACPCEFVVLLMALELPELPMPPELPLSTMYCTAAPGIGPVLLIAVTVTVLFLLAAPVAMNGAAVT